MTVPHLIPAMEASTAPAAFAAVRAHGLRLSSARRLLLQALFDADRPLSAEELAGDGDVASAYRNLEVLEVVVCERCGDVSPLSADAVGTVRLAVLDALGYRARFTHFPLAGLCPVCVSEAG